MALTVVLLHSLPSSNTSAFTNGVAATAIVCRAAVPFFFITSGYFLRPFAGRPQDAVVRPLKKLAPIFLFWLVVYYIFCAVVPGHPWIWRPRDLLSGGTAFHLWFLPALGFGSVAVSLGVRFLGARVTAVGTIALAALTLTYNAYYGVLNPPGPPTRGGFFIAPAFVFLGYGLQRWNFTKLPVAVACTALAGSFAALMAEEFFIAAASGEKLRSHDFTVSTFALGVAAFLLARTVGNRNSVAQLSKLGPFSLGIYTSHLLFIWVTTPLIPPNGAKILIVWIISSIFALGTTYLLKRFKLFERFV